MRQEVTDRYLAERVNTASPAELVGMLFDAGLRAMQAARTAIAAGTPEAAHRHLLKAQAVVTELRCSLDTDGGGELAERLDAIYEYAHRVLVDANVHKDTLRIDEVVAIVTPLRDTWRQACTELAAAAAS